MYLGAAITDNTWRHWMPTSIAARTFWLLSIVSALELVLFLLRL